LLLGLNSSLSTQKWQNTQGSKRYRRHSKKPSNSSLRDSWVKAMDSIVTLLFCSQISLLQLMTLH